MLSGDAPELDSTKYRTCLKVLDERHLKERCDFYVEWYERSEQRFGMTEPQNYPDCVKYY